MVKDKGNEVLRKMRRGLGIRQVWLSKQTGIYRTKLSQWEQGQVELTADELLKVGDAIGAVVKERSEAGILPRPTVAPPQTSIEQGKAVAEARRTWGITQSELARASEKSGDTISLFENGYIELDTEELKRVIKALGALVNKKREKAGLSKLPELQSSLATETDAPQKFSLNERRKALREFRERAGLTLQKAADLCGLSKSMLSLFETGKRDLSPEAMIRLEETITDVLSEKKAKEKLESLRKSEAARKLFPPENFGRITSLASLKSPSIEPAQGRTRQLEEIIQTQKQMIAGYQKLHSIDEQIIALLKESEPGSAAMQGAKALEEVERLSAENKELREWLNAEEVAALAQGKAAELREQVNSLTVAGMQKENAKADADE